MTDERDLVRERIDIVDLVGREVSLKRTGKNYKGLCPFHQDRNPSFYVTPETGRYKCWSCGEAGDVFTWVMKRQNVDFPEALRILAKEAGVALQSRSSVPPSVRQAQEAAMDEALRFFREQFARSTLAQEYCAGRALDAATLDAWEIGYAPDVGEALAVHLKRKNFNLAECKSLFLVDQDSGGGYFDKFRGRLILPIRDERGQLVAFGGRILGQGHPKYINSGDTPLYRKSRVLYGMNRARERLSAERRAVLVEGYLDVIACHRAGVTGAVASLGTSLAEDHAKLLKRWCDEVVILYDSDEAGQKAAHRALKILESEGLKVRVALMPPGEDPDTLLRNSGPQAVQRAVEGGLTPVDFNIQALAQRLNPQQEEFWTELVAILAESPSEMELERHVVRFAPQYPGLRDSLQAQKALRQQIGKVRRQLRRRPNEGERPVVAVELPRMGQKLDSAEVVVFRAFLDERFRRQVFLFARKADLFTTDLAVRLSNAVAQAFPSSPPEGPPATWLHRVEPDELRQVLSDLPLDVRAANLSDAYVADAIGKLREMAGDRMLREAKLASTDDQARQEYLMNLRRRKPDARAKPQDEEGLF